MPYTVDNPPEIIKSLPKHAIEIFVAAFNSALKQYKDEDRARQTAWAAVKTKYKKEGDEWVAKESFAGLSIDDLRNLLQASIDKKFPKIPGSMERVWISDVYEEKFVYRLDGVDYEASYVIDESGNLSIGEPIKVQRRTVYLPIESLRQKHSEIVKETGKRNSLLDSDRIKRIISLCQELLSSELEKLDDEKVNEAIREADSVLVWIKEQAMIKTEEGQNFPASAFAYVPDKEKPNTWKLRLWESTEKKITKAQLGRAAAALSPGGFKGQKVQIASSSELTEAKRKIRSEYRKLGVEDEEIPRWISETENRILLTGFIPLTEAKITGKGIAQVTIIEPGFNASKERYYPLETLTRDFTVFEGIKMYADHPTEEENKSRPERSIRDWVATLKNVKMTESRVTGDAVIIEPWMQERLAVLRDKGMLSEMGISINAVGTASIGEVEGIKTQVIERLVRARSVDFVTEPGAGGVVEVYEADKELDIDLISLITFKERRPDLIKQLESTLRNEILQEVKKLDEQEKKIGLLEAQITDLTKERDELKIKQEAAEKAKRIAETKAIVDEAVGKADLLEPAKAKILERFKDAEDSKGLEEAINSEKDYIAALTESGKVKGMGGKQKENPEEDKKALRESLKAMHPEYTEAQVKVFLEGK